MTRPLPSWKDGPARDAVVDFVRRVTDPDGAEFVSPEERVAAFDNDGTLWCERPMPQGGFIARRLAVFAESDPSLRERQPWKMAWEGDVEWIDRAVVKHQNGDNSDLDALLAAIGESFSEMSVERFSDLVAEYFADEVHPRFGCRYPETVYVPMMELLDYLHAHDFATYVVSGGGRDFMRPFAEEVYGIPPERVIGSSSGLSFVVDDRGAHVTRNAIVEGVTNGPLKAISLWDRTGRRPILAGGNANGDVAMFQFTGGAGGPALRLLVRHDDAVREFAYDQGADAALTMAEAQGWTVVSMQDDWKRIFPFEAP